MPGIEVWFIGKVPPPDGFMILQHPYDCFEQESFGLDRHFMVEHVVVTLRRLAEFSTRSRSIQSYLSWQVAAQQPARTQLVRSCDP